jgi:hypothetical protein
VMKTPAEANSSRRHDSPVYFAPMSSFCTYRVDCSKVNIWGSRLLLQLTPHRFARIHSCELIDVTTGDIQSCVAVSLITSKNLFTSWDQEFSSPLKSLPSLDSRMNVYYHIINSTVSWDPVGVGLRNSILLKYLHRSSIKSSQTLGGKSTERKGSKETQVFSPCLSLKGQ